MPRWSWVAALTLCAIVAGCAAPAGPALDQQVNEVATTAAPDGPGYRPNLWLLDAARPASATVSAGAEPSMLADRNGRFLWVADTTGSYVSTDNGTTWAKTGAYAFDIGVAFTDGVALAQDRAGRLYAAVLNDNRVDVISSMDGGTTWEASGVGAGVSGTADRPWLAADVAGEVVLFYYDAPFVVAGLWEHCARSVDGGKTFLDRDPMAMPPTGGSAFFDGTGRFYFANSDGVLYRYATTCGDGSVAIPMIDSFGANLLLQGTADGTDLFMVATDAGGDIVLAGSRNGGPATRLTVSPPMLAANAFSTVSAQGGVVAVAWYGSETAGDPSNGAFAGSFNVYVARVRDFWGSPRIEYFRVTSEPNHVGDICMGGLGCSTGTGDRDLLDYFMVDQDIWGGIHVAYGHDGAGSSAEVRHAHIRPGDVGEVLGGTTGSGSSTSTATTTSTTTSTTTTTAPPPPPSSSSSASAGPQPESSTTTTTPPPPVVPTASFTAKARGLELSLDGRASSDPQGDALAYAWTFGDGFTATGPTAKHLYLLPAAYEVKLRVTDPQGNHDDEVRSILVDGSGNIAPVARIKVEPSTLTAGQRILLTDASTDDDGHIAQRAWDVAGRTGTNATIAVELPAGLHRANLTVTDDAGARATTSVALSVAPAAAALKVDGAGLDRKQSPGLGFGVVIVSLGLLAVALATRRALRP